MSTVDDSNITQQPKVNLVSWAEEAGGVFRSLAPQSFMNDLWVAKHGKHGFVRKNVLFKKNTLYWSTLIFRNKHLSSRPVVVYRVLKRVYHL